MPTRPIEDLPNSFVVCILIANIFFEIKTAQQFLYDIMLGISCLLCRERLSCVFSLLNVFSERQDSPARSASKTSARCPRPAVYRASCRLARDRGGSPFGAHFGRSVNRIGVRVGDEVG